MNTLNNFEMEDYTEHDRVAVVARRLYGARYNDVRRPDRTRLWKTHQSLSSVLGKGIHENSVPYYSKGRAKYVKEEHAIAFLDDYIDTRINSNGTTRSPIDEREQEQKPSLRFGFVQRWLGIDKLAHLLNHLGDIQLRQLEQLNELNEQWKPTNRSNPTNGQVAGVDKKREG